MDIRIVGLRKKIVNTKLTRTVYVSIVITIKKLQFSIIYPIYPIFT